MVGSIERLGRAMEQRDLNSKIIQNQNEISEIRGKWDSLATKTDISDQTIAIEKRFDALEEKIGDNKSRVSKIIGIGIGIGFLLPIIVSIVAIAASFGLIA